MLLLLLLESINNKKKHQLYHYIAWTTLHLLLLFYLQHACIEIFFYIQFCYVSVALWLWEHESTEHIKRHTNTSSVQLYKVCIVGRRIVCTKYKRKTRILCIRIFIYATKLLRVWSDWYTGWNFTLQVIFCSNDKSLCLSKMREETIHNTKIQNKKKKEKKEQSYFHFVWFIYMFWYMGCWCSFFFFFFFFHFWFVFLKNILRFEMFIT